MTTPEKNPSADYSTGVQALGFEAETLKLMARVEALLFVAPGSVEVGRLATALDAPHRQVEAAIEALEAVYRNRGLTVEHNRYGVQLTSDPGLAQDVERFLELETTSRLSKAALEVLAVVAYQEPVTRPYIDSIRGVNSDSSLRTLMRYGLVEEVGRTDAPGRPILYATTPDFLQYFGLSSLEELPPFNLEEEFAQVGGSTEEQA
ncbi:MAG: SMC-Scp complex subunit ScpB [Anaerolineales bacterium]